MDCQILLPSRPSEPIQENMAGTWDSTGVLGFEKGGVRPETLTIQYSHKKLYHTAQQKTGFLEGKGGGRPGGPPGSAPGQVMFFGTPPVWYSTTIEPCSVS